MTFMAVLAVVATVTAPLGVPASAETSARGEVHCVVEVQAVGSVERQAAPRCFTTKAEAAGFLDASMTRADAISPSAVSSSVALGTVYADTNYGGSSLTMWGSSGCSGATYGFGSLAGGWDSRVSSAKAFNGCWVTLYRGTGYSGDRLNCTPSCSSVGSLNDQVRSLVFRPWGTLG